VTALDARGIELRSLKENIDTTTPTGKLMFHLMAALAEFERDVTRERTLAGLEAARARGRKGGRPSATQKISAAAIAGARKLYHSKTVGVAEIMQLTGFRAEPPSINMWSTERRKGERP
jgi:DNA invertase Pin-like site-specific DNA recombinase